MIGNNIRVISPSTPFDPALTSTSTLPPSPLHPFSLFKLVMICMSVYVICRCINGLNSAGIINLSAHGTKLLNGVVEWKADWHLAVCHTKPGHSGHLVVRKDKPFPSFFGASSGDSGSSATLPERVSGPTPCMQSSHSYLSTLVWQAESWVTI